MFGNLQSLHKFLDLNLQKSPVCDEALTVGEVRTGAGGHRYARRPAPWWDLSTTDDSISHLLTSHILLLPPLSSLLLLPSLLGPFCTSCLSFLSFVSGGKMSAVVLFEL